MNAKRAFRTAVIVGALAVIGCAEEETRHARRDEDRPAETRVTVREDDYRDRAPARVDDAPLPPPPVAREEVYVERPAPPREPVRLEQDVRSAPPPEEVIERPSPPREVVRVEQPQPPLPERVDVQDDRPVDANVIVETPDYDSGEDVSYFQNDLKPYGDWVVTAEFGRCFRPRGIDAGWRPYTVGRWCYTDDGWLWASDEPYGWATYHYGRWYEDSHSGWVWVPGRTWAPAWVAWREGGGCVGWAPIPPHRRGTSVNIQLEINRIRIDHYNFVDEGHIADPHVRQRVRPVQQNVTIINNTTNITNITTVNNKVVNRGIDPTVVERAGGKKVERVKVVETNTKGPAKQTGTEVAVFKPNIPPKRRDPKAPEAAVTDKPAPAATDKKPAETAAKEQMDSRARGFDAQRKDPKKDAKSAEIASEKPGKDSAAKVDTQAKGDDAPKSAKPDPRAKIEDPPKPNPADVTTNDHKADSHGKPDAHAKVDDPPKVAKNDDAPKGAKNDDAKLDSRGKTEAPRKADDTQKADDPKPEKHAKPADAGDGNHPAPDPRKADKPKPDDAPKPEPRVEKSKPDDGGAKPAPKADDQPKAKKPDTDKDPNADAGKDPQKGKDDNVKKKAG